ncbi:alpha/beta hydrolase [Roseobacter sp. N2S]|uniref:alpha/beta hydrolase n=1 Tax=Roseobacter sp. N2S TaxID=2663844 RepID=UPI002864F909|nr:alpha/beta hydrolase [Roseobacter sp. N2S]MDR6264568.1 hypothetical protein [Roseobacter sp. N2S]
MTRFLIIGVVVYLMSFGGLVLFQDRILYPFDPTEVTPETAGEPRLTVKRLRTSDDEHLVIWVAPPKASKPTIIYFHGNAGNLALRTQRFNRMLDRGYGVVAMAYRGSSGSSGKPSETAVRSDTLALIKALPDLLGPQPQKLVYYGESLGSAVAVQLAAIHPPSGLVLEAPFESIDAMARQRMPVFPTSLGLHEHWNTLGTIPKITSPLLVMHGTMDTVVPYDQGLAVFEAAASKRKVWRGVKGVGHVGHWDVAGQKAIYRFIDSL